MTQDERDERIYVLSTETARLQAANALVRECNIGAPHEHIRDAARAIGKALEAVTAELERTRRP